MVERVITGGQTGVDQGALRAARAAGIATGGWAPRGWLVEGRYDLIARRHVDEPAPWLADFGLIECPEPGYPARTAANVRDAHALLWFGDTGTYGARRTLAEATRRHLQPFIVNLGAARRPSQVADFLRSVPSCRVLMVAGNRESKSLGIGQRTEWFLGVVFRMLREGPREVAPLPVEVEEAPRGWLL
mgnify:CR=1 FL=1